MNRWEFEINFIIEYNKTKSIAILFCKKIKTYERWLSNRARED